MKLEKKIFLVLIMVLGQSINGIDMAVVPFYSFTDNPDMELDAWEKSFFAQFSKELENHPSHKNIPLIVLGEVDPGKVRSALDAQSFCSGKDLDILIFGNLKRARKYVELEIYIFDAGRNDIVRTLFFKEDLGTRESILSDGVEKLYKEMGRILGKDVNPDKVERAGFWNIHISAGYWLPWADWFSQVIPTAFLNSGLSITLPGDLWRRGNLDVKGHFQGAITYENGLSGPNQSPFLWNGLDLSVGGGLTFTMYDQHSLSLTLLPNYRLQILGHQAPYEDYKVFTYSQVGMGANLGYGLLLDENRTSGIGVRVGVQCLFLDPVLWKSSFGLYGFWGGELK